MCECVETLCEELRKRYPLAGSRRVERVEPRDVALDLGRGETTAVMVFEQRVEGLKKRPTLCVAFAFCPFCGQALREQASAEPAQP